MPLITCPDCSTEVSDAAPACPKCARPMPKAVKPEETLLTTQPKMAKEHPILFVLCLVLIPVYGLGLIILLGWWLSCKAKFLTVTSRRTIYREGLLSKRTSEVRHSDVRNIVVSQGIMDRIFGVGTVAISSAGQSGFEVAISGVEDPVKIKELIDGLRP
jgi:hypothetical protein